MSQGHDELTDRPRSDEDLTTASMSRAQLTRRGFIAGGSALGGAAALSALAAPAALGAPGGSGGPGGPGGVAGATAADSPEGATVPGQFPDVRPSRFLPAAAIQSASTVSSPSLGDLWPSCWADDGEIYAANGDGKGFDLNGTFEDCVVSRISGTPQTGITGTRLAAGAQLTPVWDDPTMYNRKPTGMVCVDGTLYLAIQDLRYGDHAFNDVPSASITRSDDHGVTWHPTSSPMFTDHRFTTVFFIDFGQDGSLATQALGPRDGGYVYAYGLDWNWRQSFDETVPSPTSLYLARVPKDSVQDRAAWTFYSGCDGWGRPSWSAQITDKVPVLSDQRRLYQDVRDQTIASDLTMVSQGGVVYNAPLRRYLYTSWTQYTFEFYESPTPWGPWTLFLHRDFGAGPWYGPGPGQPGPNNGGYATTIPSKFISADGRTMWVQSNWFVGAGVNVGQTNYDFNLRRLTVSTPHPVAPGPGGNLARSGDAVVIEKCAHYGHTSYLNDGNTQVSEDSFDGADKLVDYWGYEFPGEVLIGRVVYTTGTMFPDGGWFSAYDGGLRVEVRRDGRWVDVPGLRTSPAYPYSSAAGPHNTFTLTFSPVSADGVRIIGPPSGENFFTSIAELEVYSR